MKEASLSILAASSDPVPEAIRAALDCILAAPEFQRNPSSSRFLKFIVEETLEGRGGRLKAFTIATMALDRPEDFNPQSNSIVRVQAMRLRELLVDYYAGPGSNDAFEIRLQRGNYRPEFVRRLSSLPAAGAAKAATEVEPVATTFHELTHTKTGSGPPSMSSRWPLILLIAATFIALLSLLLVLRFAAVDGGRRDLSGPPVVVVLPPEFMDASTGDPFPTRFLGAIESGLSAFDNITVQNAKRGSETFAYSVSGRFLETSPGRFEINLRLLRGPGGDVVWSHRVVDIDSQDSLTVAEIERLAVIRIGDAGGGAVFADVRARLSADHAPLTGFACIMAGVEFVRERQEERRAATSDCLESELLKNPEDFRALSSLATILTINYLNNAPQSRGMADLQRALELARRALEIAPQHAEAQTAVFFTRFYAQRFDDAFQAARDSVRMNPNSSLLMARVARAYISRERYDEGLALMAPFEAANSDPPASLLAPLAIAALMRGDREKALGYAKRTAAAAAPLGLAVRIAACQEVGDSACAAAAVKELQFAYPGFAMDVPAALERHAYSDSIRARLLRDMAEAGWKTTSATPTTTHDVSIKP